MTELLWLLLPVAAFSGWITARNQSKNKKRDINGITTLHSQYFQSINYLLNDQTDKAVDVLTRMLEVNQDTIELHLALGYLFRRRGEVDRAIRLHQNLTMKSTLTEKQRHEVLLELGQDYLSAGLLDRAESIFLELRDVKDVAKLALGFLTEVYQQERDWHSAIRSAEEHQKLSGENKRSIIAHYWCEIAEEHLKQKQFQQAREMVTRAYDSDPNCARASLIAARIEIAQGRFESAIDYFSRVPEQDGRYVNEIVNSLNDCLRQVPTTIQMQSRLNSMQTKLSSAANGSASSMELLRCLEGRESAIRYIEQRNKASVSLMMLKKYLSMLKEEQLPQNQQILERVASVVDKLDCDLGDYRCERCGFFSRSLFWQCPSCKSWALMRPVQ